MEPVPPPDRPVTDREHRILAAVNAGEVMEGSELTDGDIAAALRVLRGQSTAEQERDRILDELAAARSGRESDAPNSQPSGLRAPRPVGRDLP